jgi:hypothetical protein
MCIPGGKCSFFAASFFNTSRHIDIISRRFTHEMFSFRKRLLAS